MRMSVPSPAPMSISLLLPLLRWALGEPPSLPRPLTLLTYSSWQGAALEAETYCM